MSWVAAALDSVSRAEPREVAGRVASISGLTLRVTGARLPVGGLVRIQPRASGLAPVPGEVIGCTADGAIVMPLGNTRGLAAGDRVIALQSAPTVALGASMLGRILDGLGRPIDGLGPLLDTSPCEVVPAPLPSLARAPIDQPLSTGVRCIDAVTTVGRGQRLGLFAGPGVGKSSLLGSIARNTRADVSVIALIGERGREVQDFIQHSLGPEGLARSVVIVSTGDESPLMRVRAAYVATAAAEFFRAQCRDVVLMMDSVTRFCHAQRQIGLAVGEPPATRGYTPGVFSALAGLLERAGRTASGGSITGFYTVLVEGDDMTEPVADAARGILDGHIMLSRRLANRAHFPAVDVLDSVSRVADAVTVPEHSAARRQIIRLLAAYSEVEEMVNLGAYVRGASPLYDVAIDFKPRIDAFLQQSLSDRCDFAAAVASLRSLADDSAHLLAAQQAKSRSQAQAQRPAAPVAA